MAASELILLVTSIPDHFESYERALRRAGYRVHAVATAGDALAFTTIAAPDIAVVDVRLPDMSGWDLCRTMKGDPASRSMPVLILARDVSKTSAEDGRTLGCDAWVTHPARAEDVVHAVDKVLGLELEAPGSVADAVIGVSKCPACDDEHIKATLRMSPIQYYACSACGWSWRVSGAPA